MPRFHSLPRPKGEKELSAAAEGLDFILEKFGGESKSKNEVARNLGYSRNAISWWWSKGYIGRKAAYEIYRDHGVDPLKIRPDIALRDPEPGVPVFTPEKGDVIQ